MAKAALILVACWVAVASAAFTYPEILGTGANGWTGLCQTNGPLANAHQSPINIISKGVNAVPQNTAFGRYKYWQPSLGITSDTVLKNNGHGVELELKERHIQFTSTSFPLTYAAAQLHFHAPSEHTIDGETFPLELHIVHLSANAQKAVVVGIIFEEGHKEDPLLAQLLPHLHAVHDVGTETEISFIPAIYIPNEFYEYEGSLTTPECAEIVHWMLATKTRSATKEQIEAFQEIMIHNGVGNNRTPGPRSSATVATVKTKFLAGNVAHTGPFDPPNSIHPTYVESILPAGNRVLVELSQGQLQDSFGIHESQIANLWTNPVDFLDGSGIDAETAVVVAIGPDAAQGAEWHEGATVIVDLEGCDSVGLNGILYYLCDAGSIYGEITVESWGANGAHAFAGHLNDGNTGFWRHRTF